VAAMAVAVVASVITLRAERAKASSTR